VCLQRRRGTRAFNGAMDVTLTDGGIETRIIYEFKARLATSRPTSCSQTKRAPIFSSAFTRAMLK
jgi:hypothetical protein